jgi:hypothetical protein
MLIATTRNTAIIRLGYNWQTDFLNNLSRTPELKRLQTGDNTVVRGGRKEEKRWQCY